MAIGSGMRLAPGLSMQGTGILTGLMMGLATALVAYLLGKSLRDR